MRYWSILLALSLLIVTGGVASAAWVHTTPIVASHELVAALPGTTPAIPSNGEPDEEDDPADLQGEDACEDCGVCPETGSESTGPGMHIATASGNIWTRVPVVRMYGGGSVSLDITLYYNSLRSHENLGTGYGWTQSQGMYWYYAPADAQADPPTPDRVVFVDGDGRRNAYAWDDTEQAFANSPGRTSIVYCDESSSTDPTYPWGYTKLIRQTDSGTCYYFNEDRHVSHVITASKLMKTFTYTNGLLTGISDGYGKSVTFLYDASDRLQYITAPGSHVTQLIYDDPTNPGHLIAIRDPDSNDQSFEYEVVTRGSNELHRMTRETLRTGTYFTCEYDDTTGAMSRTIKDSSDPQVVITSAASTSFPMVRGERITNNTTVTVTDDRGIDWVYTRDNWWNITKLVYPTDPSDPSPTVVEAYSIYGTDATGAPYEYARLIETGLRIQGNANPLRSREFEYDANGQIISIENEEGQITTFEYTQTWDHDNDDNTDEVPAYGLKTKKTLPGDMVHPIWEYAYDPDTLLLSEVKDPIREGGTPAEDHTINYAYTFHNIGVNDSRIHTVTRTDRNGYFTTWEYDTDGKLLTKTQQTGGEAPDYTTIVTTYLHDDLGRMTRETIDMGAADDVVTAYEYNTMGRVTAIVRDPGAGNLALRTEYAYDEHGLLETVTDPKGTITKYTYDNRNRQATVTEDFGEGRLNLVTQHTYAADGTVTITDPRTNGTQYEYGPRRQLARILDAEGYETLYERDLEGDLVKIDRGRSPGTGGDRDVKSYDHDALGRVVHSAIGVNDFPAGEYALERWYTYPTASCGCGGVSGNVPSLEEIGPANLQVSQTSREFDLMGRVEYVTRPNAYDGNAVTQYEYDPEGQVTKIWGPEGEEVEYTYDGAGRVRLRRVLASAEGDPVVETWLHTVYTYDPAGNVKTMTLPNGHTLSATYDAANRLLNVTEMDGQTQKTLVAYVYDDNGNVFTRTDGEGNFWTYYYDALNRLYGGFDPCQATFTYGYDEAGNLVYMQDRKNIRTQWTYDGLNRMTEKTEDAPPVSTTTATYNTKTYYEYDGSRLVEVRDHDANATTYDFNSWGLLEKITYPDTGDVDFTYDDWGFPYQRVDQRNITTTYYHDVQGQLRERYYNPGSGTNRGEFFEYDGSGRLVRAHRDPYIERPFEFQRTYDLAGRPTSETLAVDSEFSISPYTTNVAYSINQTTHVADWTMTTPAGRQVVHELDRLGRLASAYDANDSTIGVDWSFDDAGRRSAVGYRISPYLNATYDYDPNGRTTSIEFIFSIGGVDDLRWGEHYGYDREGNRTYTERLHTPNRSEVYRHDRRYRLTRMDRGTLASDKQSIRTPFFDDRMATYQQWYALDRRGNWLLYFEGLYGFDTAETRTVNGVNEYTTFDIDGPSLPEVPVPLGYDAAGNLTVDMTAPNWGDASAPSGQVYLYDGENRLVEVIRLSDSQTLVEYEYDALGRRIHTIEYLNTNGTVLATPRVTRHVYFGMEVIEEYTVDNFDLGNEDDTLAREFIWGDSSRFPEPVVMIDYTDAGDVAAGTAEEFHYLHDALGNVVALIRPSGVIAERYMYDPYGETFIEANLNLGTPHVLTPVDTSKYGNPFRWTGQRYDETAQLYSFFFRHYSPRHGRWLQRDPAGYVDGVNLYEYVKSSPLKGVDPLGLSASCGDATDYGTPVEEEEPLVFVTTDIQTGCEDGIAGASASCRTVRDIESTVLNPAVLLTVLGPSDIENDKPKSPWEELWEEIEEARRRYEEDLAMCMKVLEATLDMDEYANCRSRARAAQEARENAAFWRYNMRMKILNPPKKKDPPKNVVPPASS